jgi:hypothetical protein
MAEKAGRERPINGDGCGHRESTAWEDGGNADRRYGTEIAGRCLKYPFPERICENFPGFACRGVQKNTFMEVNAMETQVMTPISVCAEVDCAYNQNKKCHTIAISVGSPGGCAQCDTFFKDSTKGGNQSVTAGVGACREQDCRFNEMLECSAKSVSIIQHMGHPDCGTFKAR